MADAPDKESRRRRSRSGDDALEDALRRAAEQGGAGALNDLGQRRQLSGDMVGARAAYERAAAAGSVDALDNLGLLLHMLGELEAAEPLLRRAAASGHVDALNHLGLLLRRRGRLEEAEQVFRRAAAEGSDDALTNLGIAFQTRGAIDEGQQTFAQAEARKAQLAAEAAARGASEPAPSGASPPEPATEAIEHATEAPATATEAIEPAPEDEAFCLAARAISDLPAEEDMLGFSPLVDGLRALLNVRRTQLPLALAITAPWGAGKSSVMLQLRRLLREPGDRQPQERRWWTVDFPAWKYERSERLWAALAKAIYEQPQRDMHLLQRMWFRARVERERLGWRRFLLKGAWPPLAAAGAVLAGMGAAGDLDGAATPALISSASALSLGAAHYWGLASKPFKRAVDRYVSAPDYDGQLGFTAEADRDIRGLTRVLAPDSESDPRALAVFVDDLDRCTSAHVVEVVEAMNQIFNSDGRHGCVFVLGIDREVVATSIEVAYEPTVRTLRAASRPVGEDFGMHFLAKLVQLSVAVPQPSEQAIERLLARITGNEPRPGEQASGADVERAEAQIRGQAPETLADVAALSANVEAPLRPAAASAGERRVRAEMIRDSPDVAAAELELLRHLDRNPRQVKRFDNAFRLQLYVANEDPDCRLSFGLDELIALGKWVALRLRWPELAEAVDDEPHLLAALEAAANDDATQLSPGELDRLERRHQRWFADRAVLELLRDPPDGGKRRRVTTLEPGSFLRVT